MPPKLQVPKTKSEYHKASLEKPVTEICTNEVCILEAGSKHNTMKEHLVCRRKQQRADNKKKQKETAPIIPDGQFSQEFHGIAHSLSVLNGKVPEMMEDIATKGYTIQHFHKVSAETVQCLKKVCETELSEGIDNEGEALKEVPKVDADQCRRAIPLTPDIPNLVGLFQVLAAFVVACGPSIFNPWRVLSGNWNLLFNKPPCQQQIYHKDYDAVIKGSSEDIARKARGRGRRGAKANRDVPLPLAKMPLSVLFSVEDNTYWYAGAEKFHLPAGSFVIFRGDLEHSGAEYTEFSVRLHAYFDHPCISTPLRFTKTGEKAIFYTGRAMQA